MEGWEVFTPAEFLFSLESRGTTATAHVLFEHAFTLLSRWWRGKELQRKFERNTTGCREKEKTGDSSKEPTPRFSNSCQCFSCTTSALIPPPPLSIYPWNIIQILIINLFNSTQSTLVSIHSFFFFSGSQSSYFCSSLPFDFLGIQGTISVGVDATDLFDRYDEDFEEMPGGGFPHIEINKMHISQSIEVCIKSSAPIYFQQLTLHLGQGCAFMSYSDF